MILFSDQMGSWHHEETLSTLSSPETAWLFCEKALFSGEPQGRPADQWEVCRALQGSRARGHSSLLLCGALGHLLKTSGGNRVQEANDPCSCVSCTPTPVVAPAGLCVHHIQTPTLCLAWPCPELSGTPYPAPALMTVPAPLPSSFIQLPLPQRPSTHTPQRPSSGLGDSRVGVTYRGQPRHLTVKGENEDCRKSDWIGAVACTEPAWESTAP